MGNGSFVDLCLSDGLPCCASVKGVGCGACVKRWGAAVRVCCRFSDVVVSLLERSISENGLRR
jgi:hypothetical protein